MKIQMKKKIIHLLQEEGEGEEGENEEELGGSF